MRLFTAALVGVGLLQLIAFIWQAVSLKTTIEVMRETGERQLRAYLGVVAASVRTIEQDEEKAVRFEMKPIIRNTGQTPAYNVKYRSRAAILTFPLAQDFVFPLASSVAMASTTVIGADQTNFMLITTESMYGPSEVASIKEPVDKSNMRLVVYGTVDYTDAFNRPRYTNFCFFVEWSGPSLPEMLNHIRHNEAN